MKKYMIIFRIKYFFISRKQAFLLWKNYPFEDITKLYALDEKLIDKMEEKNIVLTEDQKEFIKKEFNKLIQLQVRLTEHMKRENLFKRLIRLTSVSLFKKAIFLYE